MLKLTIVPIEDIASIQGTQVKQSDSITDGMATNITARLQKQNPSLTKIIMADVFKSMKDFV